MVGKTRAAATSIIPNTRTSTKRRTWVSCLSSRECRPPSSARHSCVGPVQRQMLCHHAPHTPHLPGEGAFVLMRATACAAATWWGCRKALVAAKQLNPARPCTDRDMSGIQLHAAAAGGLNMVRLTADHEKPADGRRVVLCDLACSSRSCAWSAVRALTAALKASDSLAANISTFSADV